MQEVPWDRVLDGRLAAGCLLLAPATRGTFPSMCKLYSASAAACMHPQPPAPAAPAAAPPAHDKPPSAAGAPAAGPRAAAAQSTACREATADTLDCTNDRCAPVQQGGATHATCAPDAAPGAHDMRVHASDARPENEAARLTNQSAATGDAAPGSACERGAAAREDGDQSSLSSAARERWGSGRGGVAGGSVGVAPCVMLRSCHVAPGATSPRPPRFASTKLFQPRQSGANVGQHVQPRLCRVLFAQTEPVLATHRAS